MRLRRLELAVIALTLAFICFMGGYFTGRKGAVNVVTVASQKSENQLVTEAGAPASLKAPEEPNSSSAKSGIASTGTADATDKTGITTDGGKVEDVGKTETEQVTEIVDVPKGGDGRININLASQSELMDLPGIGSVLASRIVDYRRQHGDFSRIEDLRKVSGIGEKRYEALRDGITVG